MATGSWQTKRPPACQKQVGAVIKAGRPIKKNAKNKARLTWAKCHNVIAKLKRVDGIPDSLRKDIADQSNVLLAKRSRKLRVSEDEAVTVLTEKAERIGDALQASLQEAHAKIKEADFDKKARDSARRDAEVALAQFRQAVVDHRAAIKNTTKVIDTKRQAIKVAKKTQKQASTAMNTMRAKKQRLEAVEQDAFVPLKEMVAKGADARKRLSILRTVGKEFGFHEEMMEVLPSVLKKDLDKRRTFDGLVVERVGVEFAKHSGALDAHVKERASVVDESTNMFLVAESDLQNAKEDHEKHVRALADTEKALADAKAELLQAKRRVLAFPSDMGRAMRDLSSAKARIDKFRKDPVVRALEALSSSPASFAEHASTEQLP